jgi:hypothetical protein
LDLPCRAGGADERPPVTHESLWSNIRLGIAGRRDDAERGNNQADVVSNRV